MCWQSRRGEAWRRDEMPVEARRVRASEARAPDVTSDTLRIGDAERNQVIDELKRHCSEGRLTLDEYSERLDQVFASRTYADLARALRDLPGPVPRAGGGSRRRDLEARRTNFLPVLVILLVIGAGGFLWHLWPVFLVGFCVLRRRGYFGDAHHAAPRGPEREVRV